MRKKIRTYFLQRGFLETVRIGYRFLRYGKNGVFQKMTEPQYRQWIHYQEKKISRSDAEYEISTWKYLPKISIVTPVYNIDPQWLDECIESVLGQSYPYWELCMYDDASTRPETRACLEKWSTYDSRIRIEFGSQNIHIAAASNKALAQATGEFVGLLDHDDVLAPNALFEVVAKLQINKNTNFFYSDEDKLDSLGNRVDPFLKPDWSLHLFRAMMYVCHFVVFRKTVLDTIGGFRKGYEGSQDYDLVLRVIETIDNSTIVHIPKILYHWRKIAGSAAATVDAKSYAFSAAKNALTDYVARNNIPAVVGFGNRLGTYQFHYEIIGTPLVSIIIPFRDQKELLKQCLESILHKTIYKNYEIVLVDNDSQSETKKYVTEITERYPDKVRCIAYVGDFNFSAINNKAVQESRGDYVLFLNNDTKVIAPHWIENMLQYAQQDNVGAVGAKLLYPDGTIQHAGVVVGLGGQAAHVFMGQRPGSHLFIDVAKEYSAVTAACMMIKKNLFESVHGFDEVHLPIAYNDIDLCLRLREKGYLVIYTPFAELIHFESKTRGNDNDLELEKKDPVCYARVHAERSFFDKRWQSVIDNDPYYNPGLTRNRADYSLRFE